MDRLELHPKGASRALIIGTVAYDDIITPYGKGEWLLGGAGSYGALAASYFAPAALVGVVGYDFKKDDLERFRKRGIDIEGIQHNPNEKTFYWKGRYRDDFVGRDTLALDLNAFESFKPVIPEAYKNSQYVMIGAVDPDLQARFIDQLGQAERFIVLDTIDKWVDQKRDQLLEVLKKVSLFLLNDDEVRLLMDDSSTVRAGKRLCEIGPEYVLVKKGEHGLLLFSKQGMFALPAFPVEELRDPTGAGDSFAGAIVGALASMGRRDLPALRKALVYASAVASMTVEGFSCSRLEQLGIDAIQQRYEELLAMTQL